MVVIRSFSKAMQGGPRNLSISIWEVYNVQIISNANFSLDGVALLRSDGMLIRELTNCTGRPL